MKGLDAIGEICRHAAVVLLAVCVGSASLAQQMAKEAQARAIAFPGAEGFGQYATGGRGGKVMVVTHLADSGTGSLRWAAETKGKRIIVFAVSGTIRLVTPLRIKGDATIAGHSAPGDGICIADQPVLVDGDNVIIRYLRFRMGDRYQRQQGAQPGSGHDDALGISRKKHIILDHCSMSWSTDEVCSVYGGDSTTVQWCVIAEPLNYSYHFEQGDTDFQKHGYGGIWGGLHLSAHHNLFAHCVSRTPRFNGTRLGAAAELVDYRNNVIFNWQGNNVYGGEGGRYNVVANYYKPGPSTAKKVANRIVNPTRNEQVGFGKFYVADNVVAGADDVNGNNRKGIHIGDGRSDFAADTIVMSRAFEVAPVTGHSAAEACRLVLDHAGASFRRDTLDARIVWNVVKGNGGIIDVQGGFPHGTEFIHTLTAWPTLRSQKAPADQDQDGMPDAWEKQHHLNPADPADAAFYTLDTIYTNIEVYLQSLLKEKKK